jgi:hypothetical protein
VEQNHQQQQKVFSNLLKGSRAMSFTPQITQLVFKNSHQIQLAALLSNHV